MLSSSAIALAPANLMACLIGSMNAIKPQVDFAINRQLVLFIENLREHQPMVSTLGTYIKSRLSELGMRQYELAESMDVSNNAVSKWIKTGKISRDNFFQLVALLGSDGAPYIDDVIEASELKRNKDNDYHPTLVSLSDHPDLVAVPRVKFKLSAGVSGFAIDPENGNGKPIFFRKDFFELNNYRPEMLFSVRISGSSMEPSLWDGDLVVINTADTTPRDGEAFAINYEGELVIKRMRRDSGEWWATSDNSDQRRYAPKRCTEDVVIIGSVIYKQSEKI